MRKRVIAIAGIIVLLAGILMTACSSQKSDTADKTLVAYFSATGNTKAVAQSIAQETGADLFEIVPKVPYTDVQLGYDDPDKRITQEQGNDDASVEIENAVESFEQYSTIYIGYPIWYGKVPKIVITFMKSYDFSGKTVIPFCTSDNDPIETGLDELKAAAPNAIWLDGERFEGAKASDSQSGNEGAKEELDTQVKDFVKRTSAAVKSSKKSASEKQTAAGDISVEDKPFEEESEAEASQVTTEAVTTHQEEKATEKTTEKAEEDTTTTTESTTLGDHDTPYIPIP